MQMGLCKMGRDCTAPALLSEHPGFNPWHLQVGLRKILV